MTTAPTRNGIIFQTSPSIGDPQARPQYLINTGAYMRKAISMAAIAILHAAAVQSACAQAASSSAAAAEDRFQVKRLYKRSLHEEGKAFPDGAKGLSIGTASESPIISGSKAFKDAAEEVLFRTQCSADAMIIAKVVSQAPTLSSGKEMIFTSSQLSILSVLKPGLGLQAGGQTSVLQLGGEVVDAGQRLRVVDQTNKLFSIGTQYLMVLHQNHGARGAQDLFVERNSPVVKDDRIYPDRPKWHVFISGTPVADVQAELQRVAGLSNCAK